MALGERPVRDFLGMARNYTPGSMQSADNKAFLIVLRRQAVRLARSMRIISLTEQ
jgi:hypothetical protein